MCSASCLSNFLRRLGIRSPAPAAPAESPAASGEAGSLCSSHRRFSEVFPRPAPVLAQHGSDGAREPPTRHRRRRRSRPSPAAACCASLLSYRRRGRLKGSAVGGLGFPEDPLSEILSRLPAKSLFRFKCVSKAWFALIADCLRKFPQTLQGFFYGDNRGDVYGHFINLLGRSMPPVDPSFTFLTELPEIEKISLIRSCNGLVLFQRWQRSVPNGIQTFGYVVCNPATKEWVTVPRSGWTWRKGEECYLNEHIYTRTYLFFNPSVSSEFKLVQLSHLTVSQVYTYSSESGVWSSRAVECWSLECLNTPSSCLRCTFVNGMLHLAVSHRPEYRDAIVAVDEEGKICRTFRWPKEHGSIAFLGQSQGHLYCASGQRDRMGIIMSELLIWVLEDYGTEQWILKDVICSQLFGEESHSFYVSPIAAFHPDHKLVFFVNHMNGKLISYHMDSKEVIALGTLEHRLCSVTPYFPYFVESPALAKKH